MIIRVSNEISGDCPRLISRASAALPVQMNRLPSTHNSSEKFLAAQNPQSEFHSVRHTPRKARLRRKVDRGSEFNICPINRCYLISFSFLLASAFQWMTFTLIRRSFIPKHGARRSWRDRDEAYVSLPVVSAKCCFCTAWTQFYCPFPHERSARLLFRALKSFDAFYFFTARNGNVLIWKQPGKWIRLGLEINMWNGDRLKLLLCCLIVNNYSD